jgi:hypothetical protein
MAEKIPNLYFERIFYGRVFTLVGTIKDKDEHFMCKSLANKFFFILYFRILIGYPNLQYIHLSFMTHPFL